MPFPVPCLSVVHVAADEAPGQGAGLQVGFEQQRGAGLQPLAAHVGPTGSPRWGLLGCAPFRELRFVSPAQTSSMEAQSPCEDLGGTS